MMKYKKGVALVLAVATILTLCVGSLAYFTDRVTSDVKATAGTLDLTLTEPAVSATADLRPGAGVTVDFTLTNNGNKSADVLETLVLTCSKAMSATTEFDLYNAADVTVTNGIAAIKDGAQPLTVRTVSDDKTQITYAIPQFTLNGTGAGKEIEDGVTSNAKSSAYVLVFRATSTNDYQNVTVTLDYEAQAKQHRNTNSDAATWQYIKSETVTFAGNDAYKAVPTVPAP